MGGLTDTPKRRWLLRGIVSLAAVVGLGTASTGLAAAEVSAAATGPAQSNFIAAAAYSLLHPTASPPGANDWSCRPSAKHPNPVVLVHGTAENAYNNWAGLSGKLAADGYCVFAPNLGGTPGSPFQALGPIADSAKQLGEFVSKVLASTKASKVDIVGHSQGGMMPRYYIKNLGGSSTVDKLVALAPSNHGTDFHKLLTAITKFPGGSDLLNLVCTSCVEQEASSSFITRLNAGGETHPSVRYTVVATKTDEVVTPYTSSFLAAGGNVVNTTLQNYCLLDLTEHVGISYNPIAIRLVRNALDPSTARTPTCLG